MFKMENNSGHKWLVFAVVIVLSCTHFSVIFSFGAIFVAMLEKFKEERSTTAVVQSLLVGVTLCTGFITGILVSKYGVMKVAFAGSILTPAGFISSYFASSVLYLYISIAVVAGIGISFIYISGSIALGNTFEGSQKLLVLPLQTAAVSVGTISYPYIFNWLVNQYGLNGTFLILGGIYLNSFVFVMLFAFDKCHNTNSTNNFKSNYTNKQRDGNVEDGKINIATVAYPSESDIPNSRNERDDHVITKGKQARRNLPSKFALQSGLLTSLKELFTKQYILLLTGTSLVVASINAIMVFIVDVYVWKGLSVEDGLFSFIPLSICGLIARILPGVVKQKRGINSLILPIIYCLCGFTGNLLVILSFDYNVLLLGTSLVGISSGGLVASFSAIIAKIVDTRLFGIGIGFFSTVLGLLSAMAGPIFGALRDLTKSYTNVFIITTVVQFIGLIFMVSTLISRTILKRNEMKNPEAVFTITRL